MKKQIEQCCDALKEVLLAEYAASQMELESKVAKIKAHNDVLLAKNTLQDIKLY